MVKLFYTTYISVDLAHHEIFHAKVGKGGIIPIIVHLLTCCINVLFYLFPSSERQ